MRIQRFNENNSGELYTYNISYYSGSEYGSLVMWTEENDPQIDIKVNRIGGIHGEDMNTNNACYFNKKQLQYIVDQMSPNTKLYIGYCDHLNVKDIKPVGSRTKDKNIKKFDL